MAASIFESNLQRAMSAPIPLQTETYSPIPHSEFLYSLKRRLMEAGYSFHPEGQRIYTNLRGTKLVGFMDVIPSHREFSDDFGFRMSVGFKNSYDKSMTAALVAGATVIICSNGMVSGDLVTFKRKHTGEVLQLLRDKMTELVDKMDSAFDRLVFDADYMKGVELTSKQKAEILGVMYFEKEIVTPTQLSVVKKELTSSETFKGNTVWDLYNHVTVALKKSHPMRYVEDHIKLHDFMSDVAGINHAPLSAEAVELIEEIDVSDIIDGF